MESFNLRIAVYSLLVCVLCLFFPLISQAQWVQTSGPKGGVVTSFTTLGTTIFAGTQFGGVHRSTDNGNTWETVNRGFKELNIVTLFTSGTTLYAGTNGDGLFRSIDEGNTWYWVASDIRFVNTITEFGNSLFVGTHQDVIRSTDNGKNWTVGEWRTHVHWSNYNIRALIASENSLYAGTQGGIFRSTDTGRTWIAAKKGMTVEGVLALASINGELFEGSYKTGVFRSTDNGETWSATGLADMTVNALTFLESTLFAGTDSGVYRSNDKGVTWTQVNIGLTNHIVYALAVCQSALFAGTHGDVYRSNDLGDLWATLELANQTISDLIKIGTTIFAGTYSCVYRSKDDGNTWSIANIGLMGENILSFAVIDSILFVGTNGGGVYRSIDMGDTWTQVNSGLNFVESKLIFSLSAIGKTLFAGTYVGVYKSKDGGENWTSIGLMNAKIEELAVHETTIYASGSGRIYRSGDFGNSWFELDSAIRNQVSTALAKIGTTLFAGTEYGEIYRSTDDGVTWDRIQKLTSKNSITAFILIENALLVGLDDGVYISTDMGNTWKFSGLTNISIRTFTTIGNTLYAGTDNSGVWKTEFSTLGIQSTNEYSASDITCYPNPATNTLKIENTSPLFNSANPIQYTITSHTGETLLESVSAEPQFSISTEFLASGVYFLTARQGLQRTSTLFSILH